MSGRLYISTFGCQMNEYDSARMADVLRVSAGLEPTDEPEQADVVLLNTCSVREKAQEKVFSQLGKWRLLKRRKPGLIIGVGGCVASQEGEGILDRAPFVDLVFGPQTIHRLPEMIAALRATGRPQVDVSASRKSRNSTACRSRARKGRPPSSPSWKAAASTARSASCPTRAARK